jgi:acyl-CoA dehydrogenase
VSLPPQPAPQLQWRLPFFEPRHAQLAADLAQWTPEQAVDERDDRAACREWVKRLGADGWLKYCVAAAHGGALPQLDSRALVVLRESLAFHSPLADFAFAMQGLGSGAISLSDNAAMQNEWLPKVSRGEAIAAFALSEPDAGSDVAAMKTVAEEVQGTPANPLKSSKNAHNWLLKGTKTWISNGGIADFYTVFAKTDAHAGARGITAFVVPSNAQGLDDSAHIDVIAPHPLATVELQQCAVDDAQRISEAGEGFKLAMRTLDIFRASVAAAALGMARRALVEAAAYASQRKMFGATLADQQLTQAKLGEMQALIDAGALLTYRAAWMRDASARPSEFSLSDAQATEMKERYTAAAASAKLTATENAQVVIDLALQMHGGMGVRVGQKIEALYRDIRALRIYEGASEVQQLIIGKAVLKGRA